MNNSLSAKISTENKAIWLGHPSYVWRFGQDRRLSMINQYAPLIGRRILDAGCGVGMYVRAFRHFSADVHGLDIDVERIAQSRLDLPGLVVASVEALPYPDESFDVVLSHEVIEHVTDDRRTIAEAVRVLRPGGRLVLFCPNRLWPFETHGAYWKGQYHFGNVPLINWLPDCWRDRLAPHVRVYTTGKLRRLLRELPVRIVVHRQIYPGFDNVAVRWRTLAKWTRLIFYTLERLPVLRSFGLSHLLVVERLGRL